ncbi:MAG: FmdB family zinc ribbon protein [Candidatus Binataceae bacterium]
MKGVAIMPIYEYRCDDCANSFETLVRTGHEDHADCPACHGVNLSRELSVFASARADASSPAPAARGGGCCGGGCGCH